MKIFSKIIYGLFITLLIGISGLFLASMLPIPGNIEIKIVKSGSMFPAIETGAVVVVKPGQNYVVGDVITFGEDTLNVVPTTHRIVSVREEGGQKYFTTKGDANEEADPEEVPVSIVIGKVIFNAPYVGYILDFAKQPRGFAFLIGIPAALVIFDELAVIFGELKKYKRRRGEEGQGIKAISTDKNSGMMSAVVDDMRNSSLQAAGIRRIVH